MLKPFRIADLSGPAPDQDQELQDGEPASLSTLTTEVETTHQERAPSNFGRSLLQPLSDGVIHISEGEYDKTISINPEAKLSYLDDDDGETVTVGSSLELAQRLDEPLPAFASTSNPGNLVPMHIFDIRKSSLALDTWRNIQAKNYKLFVIGQPISASSCIPPGPVDVPTNNSFVDSSANGNKSPSVISYDYNPESPRALWFQSCNPPQFSNDDGVSDSKRNSKESIGEPEQISVKKLDECSNPPILGGKGGFSSEFITEEGKKQAQAAGARLRNSRHLFSSSLSTPFPAPADSKNFWTSYLTGDKQASYEEPLSQREPNSDESPITKDSLPLFTVFETELSKLTNHLPASETAADKQKLDFDSKLDNPNQLPGQSSPSELESINKLSPCVSEVFGQTFQSLLGRIAHLTSELTSRLPEVEQKLTSMEERIPTHMQDTVKDTLKAMGCHVQTLAGIMQHAASSARTAADRTVAVEDLFTTQVNGLRVLATELGDVGRNLLAAFEEQPHPHPLLSNNTPTRNQRGISTSHPVSEISGGSDVDDRKSPIQSRNAHLENIRNTSTESRNSQNADDPVESSTANQQMEETMAKPANSSVLSDSSDTLFVGNLPLHATEETLAAVLENKGFLGKVTLEKDSWTGNYIGFGYVHFPTKYAASGALQALTNYHINGQRINVELSDSFISDNSDFPKRPRAKSIPKDPLFDNPISSVANTTHHGRPLHQSWAPTGPCHNTFKKPHPNVTFNIPEISPGNPTSVRRAKSLGAFHSNTVRNDNSDKNINLQNHSEAPVEYPKYRRFKHHHSKKEGDVVSLKHNSGASSRNDHALLDQEDTNPDLAVRYPSLFNTRTGPSTPSGSLGSTCFRRPDDHKGLHPATNQNSIMQQCGRRSSSKDQSRAAIALALAAQDRHQILSLQKATHSSHKGDSQSPPAVPDKLPGSWPREPEAYRGDGNKHDEKYYESGTVTDKTTRSLRRSKSTTAQNPTARLTTPFVPFHENAHHPNSLVRRSPTEHHARRSPPNYYTKPRSQRRRRPSVSGSTEEGVACNNGATVPGSFPSENQTPAMIENDLADKTETCLNHLIALGFADEGKRGETRIRIYAEAANGNLEEAIEMIEEERKAYEQQPNLA